MAEWLDPDVLLSLFSFFFFPRFLLLFILSACQSHLSLPCYRLFISLLGLSGVLDRHNNRITELNKCSINKSHTPENNISQQSGKKDAFSSCRNPDLNTHTHTGSSQTPLTLVQEQPKPSSGLCRHCMKSINTSINKC